jgi:hypothetical protein
VRERRRSGSGANHHTDFVICERCEQRRGGGGGSPESRVSFFSSSAQPEELWFRRRAGAGRTEVRWRETLCRLRSSNSFKEWTAEERLEHRQRGGAGEGSHWLERSVMVCTRDHHQSPGHLSCGSLERTGAAPLLDAHPARVPLLISGQ